MITGSRTSVGAGPSSPSAPERSAGRAILLSHGIPILLLSLTAFVSAFRLGTKSLWHDEAFTLAVARADNATFQQSVLGQESFAALYYSVIRVMPPLWDNEASLRAPSAVFAVLTTLACYALARRLFGFRIAVIGALLLSVNLFFVQYAQEARAYALALLLVTMSAWALVRAVQRPTWPSWLALGAVSAAAVYAHFFAVLVLVSFLLSLLAHRSIVPWRKVAGAVGLAVVLVLPLAAVLLPANAGGRPRQPQVPVTALARDLAGIPPTRFGILQALVFGLCGVAALAAAVLAVHGRRGEDADPVRRWGYTLLACWLAMPVALAALVSLVWPIFVARYFVVCLPAVVLVTAVGLATARPAVQVVVLLVVLAISVDGLRLYYQQSYKEGENWRGLAQHVAEQARSGDSMIFLSRFGRRPFEYYLVRNTGLAASLTPRYPSMPWGHYPPVVGERLVDSGSAQAQGLRAAGPDRVWVVLLWGGFGTGHDDTAPFHRILTREYVRTEHRGFGEHLELARYDRI